MLTHEGRSCQIPQGKLTPSYNLPVKLVGIPAIMTTGRSNEAICADAVRALAQSGRVFVSSGKLCRRINGQIDRLNRWSLCYILSQVAQWVKRKRDGKIYPCFIPLNICGLILRQGEWPGVRVKR